MINPKTTDLRNAKQDAETWRALYERSQRENFKRQVIIETLAIEIIRLRGNLSMSPIVSADRVMP
jgi:hypothetical protein